MSLVGSKQYRNRHFTGGVVYTQDNFLKGIVDTVKDTVSGAVKTVTTAVSKTVSNIVDKGGQILDSAKFAPLLPFKSVMNNAIRSKGVRTDGKLENIADAFYQVIIRKRARYTPSNFTGDNFSMSPEAIQQVVAAVLEYIKSLTNKNKAGVELSKTEQAILNGSQAVANKVEQFAMDEAKYKTGDAAFNAAEFIKTNIVWIALGVVAAIAIKKYVL